MIQRGDFAHLPRTLSKQGLCAVRVDNLTTAVIIHQIEIMLGLSFATLLIVVTLFLTNVKYNRIIPAKSRKILIEDVVKIGTKRRVSERSNNASKTSYQSNEL